MQRATIVSFVDDQFPKTISGAWLAALGTMFECTGLVGKFEPAGRALGIVFRSGGGTVVYFQEARGGGAVLQAPHSCTRSFDAKTYGLHERQSQCLC